MAVLDRVASADTNSSPTVPRHVRHALTYMRSNFQEKIVLADLAGACGISERALLKQFRKFLGVSPMAHLTRMRLSAARDELQHGADGGTISEVALRCGFAHIGRFASEYRKAFGERPSVTVRRIEQHRTNGAGLPAVFVSSRRPLLLILPLRTETLSERRLAQELMEQIAAVLSRSRVADVSFADPGFVMARRSVRLPAGNAVTEYCLQGRLVQRGERRRVTLWLTDGEGRHIWGDSYDGSTDNLFDLLWRATDGAVLGVVRGITGAEIECLRSRDPQSLAAREMLMRIFPTILKIDPESSRSGFTKAIQAMKQDPGDALPVAFAAYCQARLFNGGAASSISAARELACQLALRAGVLDADDPLVITARASVAGLLRLRQDAGVLTERALAMDPTSPWAHERAGYLLFQTEPDGAIKCFERALQLYGPLMPRENCFNGIAQAHWAAGRTEDAVRWSRKAIAENPRADVAYWNLICCMLELGCHSEARQLASELCRIYPEISVARLSEARPDCCFDGLLCAGLPL